MRRKLNPLTDAIAGKRLVVVDDSIVRGTTQRSVIRMLREAGAAEVHLRISSPPWRWPCFYGIDTPSSRSCWRPTTPSRRWRTILGADSLAYISIENLKAAIGADGGFCDACFTGDYPTRCRRATPVTIGRPEPEPVSRARPTRPRCPGSDGRGTRAGATYAGAGVDIAAGDAAVERLRAMVAGIGGFGGQFALDRPATPIRCWWPRPTGWAPSWRWPGPPAATTPSASTWWPCASTTWCAWAPSRSSCSTTSPPGRSTRTAIATVVAGVAEGCRLAGCALIGGETAEHAGVMAADELDLAGFAVGVVEQGTQLGPERVRAGDAIVGLPSPGLRSNGYTLARHVLLERAGARPRAIRPGRARRTAWPTSCCARR